MRRALRSLVRTSAFLRKELVETVRQPMLAATLVLAPFLILLLFGIGLKDQDPDVRTALVIPDNELISDQAERFADQLPRRLKVAGLTRERDVALRELERGGLDLVVVFPDDVVETVRANERATVTLYHSLVDPIESRGLGLATRAAIDRLNTQILRTVVARGQDRVRDADDRVAEARETVANLERAARAGDAPAARRQLTRLQGDLISLSLQLPAAGLVGVPGLASAGVDASQDVEDALTNLGSGVDELAAEELTDATGADFERIARDLDDLDRALVDLRSIDPKVAVEPFRGSLRRLAPVRVGLTDFFAPGVVVLLVQHMLVTLVGLSVVREDQLGTTELFRVAPLTVGEYLTGKYLAYMLLSAVVTAVLVALLVLGLGVPLAGSLLVLAVAALALMFTSIGMGFFLALVARSDSQTVQYAMMVLLASIFLTGFVITLDRVVPLLRGVAWLLPASYGIAVLRDIMLRGLAIQPQLLFGLLGLGVALLVVSWLMLRRRLKPSGSRRWRRRQQA